MMNSIDIWYNERYCSKIIISTILTRGSDFRVKIMDRILPDLMMDLIRICMVIDIGPIISSACL